MADWALLCKLCFHFFCRYALTPPKCPTATPLTTLLSLLVVGHPRQMSMCPTPTRERTYSRWGERGTLWQKREGPMSEWSVADEAGAVGLEQCFEVLDASHEALALVGVAHQDLLI